MTLAWTSIPTWTWRSSATGFGLFLSVLFFSKIGFRFSSFFFFFNVFQPFCGAVVVVAAVAAAFKTDEREI